MHVCVGEHETAVDEKQLVVLLEDHAVAANLTETTEEINTYRSCHELTAKSGTRLLEIRMNLASADIKTCRWWPHWQTALTNIETEMVHHHL